MDGVLELPRSGKHAHLDCGPRQRVWLPRETHAVASAAKHPYCVVCGTVKSLGFPRARPLGFFLSGVANLKRHFDETDGQVRLTQVQTRLLVQKLANRSEFEDPYGTPGHVQLSAYLDVLRSGCPGIDEDLALRLLPGAGRRVYQANERNATLHLRSQH